MWKAGRGERLKFVAELLVTNEALPTSSGHCNHLVRRTWPKRRIPASKYCVNHFGMWCRRRESNDTPLLITRNLLKKHDAQNATTALCPIPMYKIMYNRNRAPRRCLKINFFRPVWEAHLKAEGRVVCRGCSLVVPLETAAPLCKPGTSTGSR